MKTEFFFIDDSINFKLNRTSITGVLVETSKIEEVRRFYFEMISSIVYPSEDAINFKQTDLHASNLFSGTKNENNDELKLKVFKGFVDIINKCKLEIKRVSIVNKRDEIKANFINIDDKFLRLLIHELLITIKPNLNSRYFIPVFDGLDSHTSDIVSTYFRNLSLVRHSNHSNLIFEGTENILGEVFYSSRKNSILIQIPDFISYLLMTKENYNKIKISKFKTEIAKIAELINPSLLDDVEVKYNINKN